MVGHYLWGATWGNRISMYCNHPTAYSIDAFPGVWELLQIAALPHVEGRSQILEWTSVEQGAHGTDGFEHADHRATGMTVGSGRSSPRINAITSSMVSRTFHSVSRRRTSVTHSGRSPTR